MSFTTHAELDLEPEAAYGDTLSLGTFRRGNQNALVFDGAAGLETVIRFDEAEIDGHRSQARFYLHERAGGLLQVGSMEAPPNVVTFLLDAVEEHDELDYDVWDET